MPAKRAFPSIQYVDSMQEALMGREHTALTVRLSKWVNQSTGVLFPGIIRKEQTCQVVRSVCLGAWEPSSQQRVVWLIGDWPSFLNRSPHEMLWGRFMGCTRTQ